MDRQMTNYAWIKDGWLDEWIDKKAHWWKNERMKEWKNERMKEWKNERMKEWKNERMKEWKAVHGWALLLDAQASTKISLPVWRNVVRC